ncbi:MAG: DUF547 domain-containing protein [Candidatus Hydrogenedentes bacterium]|nr:DUF547 domain-containing protein [Candidatus Hydrogenedentota bacterium]
MTTPKTEKSYYGPFFWIAAVSFIVPLFVAGRAFDHIGAVVGPTPVPDASGVDHALWDYVLKEYVANGLVDYDGIAKDQTFRTYIRELGAAQPEKLATDDERLALLCNAYNAFVIEGVISHGIRDSVNNYSDPVTKAGFFDIPEHILSSTTLSLNDIEHKKIREPFGDPRIHVALVCAALGCPSLRGEAYEGARLDAQLDDQARLFANNPKHVAFDAATNTLRLSRILQWYGKDWDAVGGYLSWLQERAEDPALKAALTKAASQESAVKFFEYDWVLNTSNELKPGGSADPSSGAFGSGSIPNG